MSVKYNPDVFKLGITYSHAIDFIDALETVHSCGTHTLMVCCDNEYFRLPTDAMLDGYNLVIHGPLSINLANSNLQIRKNSVRRLIAIIKKFNIINQHIQSFVIHPGSANNMDFLIESLKEIISMSEFRIAIETMAGRGKELCSTLEQIDELYTIFKDNPLFSICIDTCHMNDAGYNLEKPNEFVNQLLHTIPVERISCIHINDSMSVTGSHKDRHATIGTGYIPVSSLAYIVKYKQFQNIPKIIESPQDLDKVKYTYMDEMKLLLKS